VRGVFEQNIAGDLDPVTRYENPVLRADGEERIIAWRNTRLTDEHGRITGTFSSGEDVTIQRQLERDTLAIGQQERERIGQNLHDVLGQQLTAATLMLGAAEGALQLGTAPTPPDLAKIRALLEVTLAHTRFIAYGFLPIPGGASGLRDALEDLAANSRKLFGISCVAPVGDGLMVANANVATQLYHIAQEAITNAIRHGGATSVVLELEQPDGHLVLRVTDDGSGISGVLQSKGGRGIEIMRTRAGTIGAHLTLAPAQGGGTVVTCTLPTQALDGRRRARPRA